MLLSKGADTFLPVNAQKHGIRIRKSTHTSTKTLICLKGEVTSGI